MFVTLASVVSVPLTDVLWTGCLQGAPVSTGFFFTTFFYLPEATVETTQTTGTKPEVDFSNKSVEINPDVKTALR